MTLPDRILLAHGAGGRKTRELIEELLLPSLSNEFLATLSDAAIMPRLPEGRPALTTDGFVVDPPLFPGGDLGYLSVCGTVNDLSVAGAEPLWLTWSLILEEGLETSLLRTCLEGAVRAAREAGVRIVAGDTKVVPKGKGDRLFITTAGLGVVPPGRDLGDHRVVAGDVILATGPLGDHGATIMASRHGMSGAALRSDCAPLNGLIAALLASGAEVHSLHDPTRGGALVTCHEVCARTGLRMVIEEAHLPVRAEVAALCELLGLAPVAMPCEGRALIWLKEADAPRAIEALRAHPLGRGACAIGRAEAMRKDRSPVAMRTPTGEERPLDLRAGADLPRIC